MSQNKSVMDILNSFQNPGSNFTSFDHLPSNTLNSNTGTKILPSELYVDKFLKQRGPPGRNANKKLFTSAGSHES